MLPRALRLALKRKKPKNGACSCGSPEIDVLYAKALLARKHQCSKPRFGAAALRLPAARHPLLLASNKPVVPVDLLIPEGKNGLIITGPNTGGKTVALKTVGLLCLMAQSGLLLPVAEDNCLPIFQGVFADIGDPQSLEQNLSTFSAHMQNLVEITQTLAAPALVLFDEPGGGTDPIEGGALACGILTYLKTCGVLVAAATHLAPVKLFALADGSYQVAAVEFDLDTLTPRYRLHYDVIGQSLGLSIARRLGLPEAACVAAEAALPQDARLLTQAITKLEKTRTALEHERTRAAAEREHVEALRVRQQASVTEFERKQQALREKLTEAEMLVRRLRQHERYQSIADRRHQSGVTSMEWRDIEDTLGRSADQQENATRARLEASLPVSSELLLQQFSMIRTLRGNDVTTFITTLLRYGRLDPYRAGSPTPDQVYSQRNRARQANLLHQIKGA
jgi:dsDNA-specific endonuclease/ATPase MutS2